MPSADGQGTLFLTRYNSSGTPVWTRQFGSADGALDFSFDFSLDGQSVFVTGRYLSPVQLGYKDMFVTKINAGTGVVEAEIVPELIGPQFGANITPVEGDYVYVSSIFKDPDDQVQEDQDPTLEKRRKTDLSLVGRVSYGPGSNKEPWGGLSFLQDPVKPAGEGSLYSAGWVIGDFFNDPNAEDKGRDVWLSSIDNNLNVEWVEQWSSAGRETEWAWDNATHAAIRRVYVVGHTFGDMDGPGSQKGEGDGFISCIDPSRPDGERVLWTRHLGTSRAEEIRRIRILGDRIFVSGHTWGAFSGFSNAGETDIFVAELGLDGSLINIAQFGTDRDERANIAVDGNRVAVAGFTEGSFAGSSAGFLDGYVFWLSLGLNP